MNHKIWHFRLMLLLILTVGAGINYSFARCTSEWDTGAAVPLAADTVHCRDKVKPDSVHYKTEIKRKLRKRRKDLNAAWQQATASEKSKALESLGKNRHNAKVLPEVPEPQDVSAWINTAQNSGSIKASDNIEKVIIQDETEQSGYPEAIITQDTPAVPLDSIGEQLAAIDENLEHRQLKRMAAEQAGKHLAMDKLLEKQSQIKAAQRKFSGYKKRISWLREDSGKPSDSLKEGPQLERFVWGLNLQPKMVDPFSLGMAPYIGYRLNKKLTTGVSFVADGELAGKNSRDEKALTLSGGYRFYTDYKLIRSFFAYAEYESLYARTGSQPDNTMAWQWQRKGYAGIGRSIALSSKISLNLYFLADLTHQGLPRFHREAFQVRIGLGKGN